MGIGMGRPNLATELFYSPSISFQLLSSKCDVRTIVLLPWRQSITRPRNEIYDNSWVLCENARCRAMQKGHHDQVWLTARPLIEQAELFLSELILSKVSLMQLVTYSTPHDTKNHFFCAQNTQMLVLLPSVKH